MDDDQNCSALVIRDDLDSCPWGCQLPSLGPLSSHFSWVTALLSLWLQTCNNMGGSGCSAVLPKCPLDAKIQRTCTHALVHICPVPGYSQTQLNPHFLSSFLICSHDFSYSPPSSLCSNITFSVRPILSILFKSIIHPPSYHSPSLWSTFSFLFHHTCNFFNVSYIHLCVVCCLMCVSFPRTQVPLDRDVWFADISVPRTVPSTSVNSTNVMSEFTNLCDSISPIHTSSSLLWFEVHTHLFNWPLVLHWVWNRILFDSLSSFWWWSSLPFYRGGLRPSEAQGLSKVIWLLPYEAHVYAMIFWGCSEVSRISLIQLPGPVFFLQVREREAQRANDPSQDRVGQARPSDISYKKKSSSVGCAWHPSPF